VADRGFWAAPLLSTTDADRSRFPVEGSRYWCSHHGAPRKASPPTGGRASLVTAACLECGGPPPISFLRGGRATWSGPRQCIRPGGEGNESGTGVPQANGLLVHLRLLPTPPHKDAVIFGYRASDHTPAGTFTLLARCARERRWTSLRLALRASRGWRGTRLRARGRVRAQANG